MEETLPLRVKLSDAFPPESSKNYECIAKVHQKLQNTNTLKQIAQEIGKRLTIRNVQTEEDLSQIKDLHQEWFPLPYDNSYYSQILSGKVKSIILELELPKNQGKYIVGCLFYQIKKSKGKYLKLTFRGIFEESLSVYITTLGVVNELRQLGLASMLMKILKEKCITDQPMRIEYIYLHLVSYNHSAQKYYTKNGFQEIGRSQNHYTCIEGQPYDGLVYALYLHGGGPSKGLVKDCLECVLYPFRTIKSAFKKGEGSMKCNLKNKEQ